jgi:hypothetical protein
MPCAPNTALQIPVTAYIALHSLLRKPGSLRFGWLEQLLNSFRTKLSVLTADLSAAATQASCESMG